MISFLLPLVFAAAAAATETVVAASAAPRDYPVKPVPFTDIKNGHSDTVFGVSR